MGGLEAVPGQGRKRRHEPGLGRAARASLRSIEPGCLVSLTGEMIEGGAEPHAGGGSSPRRRAAIGPLATGSQGATELTRSLVRSKNLAMGPGWQSPSLLTAGRARYALVRPVGEGASSTVWQARDASSGSLVALKIARKPGYSRVLAEEAARLLAVDSSALTEVRDAGLLESPLSTPEGTIEAGTPYVALEWIEGDPVEPRALAPSARIDLALRVARDVGEALHDLHTAGSTHGDVKPANLLLVERNGLARVRVVDLGLGGAADEARPTGGTPRYLSPEVFDPQVAGDGRARDLWALGLTLAEIACESVACAPDPKASALTGPLPEPVTDLILALLAQSPGARPSAAWVHRRARVLLGDTTDPTLEVSRRRRAVRRSYLGLRRQQILSAAGSAEGDVAVEGPPGEWLRATLAVAERVARLRATPLPGRRLLNDLGPFGRSRWLVVLVGPGAASWPIEFESDADLANRLLQVVQHGPPEALTFGELRGGRVQAAPPLQDPLEVALALGAGHVEESVLTAAEGMVLEGRLGDAGSLALGRALRKRGELGRALALLGRLATPEGHLEAAETARRARDTEQCHQWLARCHDLALDSAARARMQAIVARLALDEGDATRALAELERAPETAATLESRALAELALGRRERAALSIAAGRALAHDDEQRARIEAVAGNLAHWNGDMRTALACAEKAAELASRASAVLEEATYLTSRAAAASHLGEIASALEAARRAVLLFEHLRRPREAARAMLSQADAFAKSGATEEAVEAARDAIARARAVGDRQCQAYAHLVLADVLADSDHDGAEHARRGRDLLETPTSDDRLRAAARCLRRGVSVPVEELDRAARSPSAAVDARAEYWTARAVQPGPAHPADKGTQIMQELASLGSSNVALALRGPALAAGAQLAAKLGDGDQARRFAEEASKAARELADRVPAELRHRLLGQAWIATLQSPRETELSPGQLTDVEVLVRALGRRDRLKPLLDQVLDALVLWTGVERGLLLLRAPGRKLVPRAARNLARKDIVGEQLSLSQTLAERALAEGEPVVATDAAGELSEVFHSVHALKLRSVLAVPLLCRGEALGVVYLDDRVRRGAFGARELSWVRLVATLAAVAIADARDQLELRRTARRAQRAEQSLAAELARREVELEVAERELARTRDSRDTRFPYEWIVGQSPQVQAMLEIVDRVTTADVPVLIVGESGSGKELVARAIHTNGPRGTQQFVTENCAAIPEPLLESTLFGHVRGAFTGANRPRAGLFEIANRGTLFLDEIGEMSLGMQTKLLRAIESGEIRPVGGERPREVDVRLIGATHRNLEQMVEAGTFRQDLFYRLNVITIPVPPLRERTGDIELLTRHFLDKHAAGRRIQISKAALSALAAFDWPGNIRQLENEIRRALVLADHEITTGHLTPEVARRRRGDGPRSEGLNVRQRVDQLESELVRQALDRTGGNQTKAAELLGLSRFGLQKMMRRLSIPSDSPRPGSTRGAEHG